MSGYMSWEQLEEEIKQMTDEQKEMPVTVFLKDISTYVSIYENDLKFLEFKTEDYIEDQPFLNI